MAMIEINNTTKFKINRKLIKKAAERFLADYRLARKNVSIAFVGDGRMRELNRRYRKKDCPTDVLSFGNNPPFKSCLPAGGEESASWRRGGSDDLGEIIIDPAQIKRQAAENGNSFQKELIFILVHGLLHLAGHDDETEKKGLAMIAEGEGFIKKFKIGN